MFAVFSTAIHAVFPADPSALGRVDRSSLPQQVLMELFVNGNSLINVHDIAGNTKPIQEWQGLQLNEMDEVVRIIWILFVRSAQRDSGGQTNPLDLHWIPSSVRHIQIQSYNVKSFDPLDFPEEATHLSIANCGIHGTLDAARLPRNLETLGIHLNALSGTIDAASLPPSLQFLFLFENAFEGSIRWSDLPQNLEVILLNSNKLTGTVDIKSLPARLKILNIGHNAFYGSVDFARKPQSLTTLLLNHNAFSEGIDIPMNCGMRAQRANVMFIHHNQFEGQIRYVGEDGNGGIETISLYCVANRFTSIDWESMRPVSNLDARQNALRQGFLKWGSRPPKGVARPLKGGRGRPKIGKTGNFLS